MHKHRAKNGQNDHLISVNSKTVLKRTMLERGPGILDNRKKAKTLAKQKQCIKSVTFTF